MGSSRYTTLSTQVKNQLEELVWNTNLSDQPAWRRGLIRTLRIGYAVGRDLSEGQLSLRAMGLVYYTVIALIPLLALTFSVLKGLGVHNAMEPALLNLLSPLGERSVEVTGSIVSFVDNVRVDVLSIVSLVVLLYTVLNMMQKVEESFNFIWSVNKGRSFANRISEYLFAIIASPLLIFVSVGITSYVSTNVFERYLQALSFGGVLLQILATITAFLVMSLAFTFAYSFIPNTRVRFRSAFIGGVMTTLIWKGMGQIFQSVFSNSTTNEVIYLAFFSVILVMIFMYLGWLVLLTGSSIAYYHQYPAKARSGRRRSQLSIEEQEVSILSVVYLIIAHFQHHEEPWSAGELADQLRLNPLVIDDILALLHDIDFIRPTHEDPEKYLPSGAVEDCTVMAIREKIRTFTRDSRSSGSSAVRRKIHILLTEADTLLEQQMGELRFIDLDTNSDNNPDNPATDGHTTEKGKTAE
ncbi:MAG: YihY/virulence factor BrkB family protein [Pseudomonadota bacterium]